ncbi:MAG TPA: hypothetical protein VL461_02720 [Dictyobacter sp.]|jgi:hypothetical protein|nr:hypothetical protein [Dictyobacter sp.]
MFERDKPKPPEQQRNTSAGDYQKTDVIKNMSEFTRRTSSDQGAGDALVIRDFYETKNIQPLSEAEKVEKTVRFNERYTEKVTRTGDGRYKVEIALKNGNEYIYTNSVDFNDKDIQGEYNYANLDTEGSILGNKWKRDPGSMQLSDIKWQTLRLATEEFQEHHPERSQEADINTFRPSVISGHDIEERNLYKTLFTNEDGLKLARNQTYTFHKGTTEFNKLMKTTQGKSNLFIIGNYFSEQTVDHVTIDTGTGKYIKKVEYHLVDKKPATPNTHFMGNDRRVHLE